MVAFPLSINEIYKFLSPFLTNILLKPLIFQLSFTINIMCVFSLPPVSVWKVTLKLL